VHPQLLKFTLPGLGVVEFPTYMTLLVVGFAFGIWQLYREGLKLGVDAQRFIDLGLWMLVWGILGSRLLAVVADGKLHDFVNLCVDSRLVPVDPHEPESRIVECVTREGGCGDFFKCNPATGRCYPPTDCLAALKFWQGGLAYYGGFLAAAAFGLWYARRHKLGVMRTADAASPYIALGLYFGRMGCFFNGCCFGQRSDSALAVLFPTKPDGPRLPMQLAEAIGALGIFVLLLAWRRRRREHGEVFAGLMVTYGVLRFVLEFWRDDPRGAVAGLSTSQLISLPLVAWGAWRLWESRARGRARDAAPPSSSAAPPPSSESAPSTPDAPATPAS